LAPVGPGLTLAGPCFEAFRDRFAGQTKTLRLPARWYDWVFIALAITLTPAKGAFMSWREQRHGGFVFLWRRGWPLVAELLAEGELRASDVAVVWALAARQHSAAGTSRASVQSIAKETAAVQPPSAMPCDGLHGLAWWHVLGIPGPGLPCTQSTPA